MTPAQPSRLTVEVVDSDDRMADLRWPWESLLTASRDASPYLTWSWATSWRRRFPSRDRLHVIAVWKGAALVALAPLVRHQVPGFGPIFTYLVGIGQHEADLGGFLLGEDPESTGPLILEHLERQLGPGLGLVKLCRVLPEADLAPLLEHRYATGVGSEKIQLRSDEYPYIAVEPSTDMGDLIAQRVRRTDARRALRRLNERFAVEFRAHNSANVAADLEESFRIFDRRWAAKGLLPHGLFATARGRRFLRDFCTLEEEHGRLRLAMLRVDGAPCAARLGIRLGDTYYQLMETFEPDLGRFRLGPIMAWQTLEAELAEGVSRVELLLGAAPQKADWATGTTTVPYLAIARSGLRARVMRRTLLPYLRFRRVRADGIKAWTAIKRHGS